LCRAFIACYAQLACGVNPIFRTMPIVNF
jgi:hypothetical protein